MDNQHKKLYRSRTDRMIFGVCGGLGEYFGVDSLVFRALFLLFSFGGGAGILAYLFLAILIQNAPDGYHPHLSGGHSNLNDFAQEVKHSAQNLAEEMKHAGRQNRRWGLVGLIIVLFGAALLLNVFLPQHWFRWDIFWPLILVFLGLAILAKKG